MANCVVCTEVLTGRQTKFCSSGCRNTRRRTSVTADVFLGVHRSALEEQIKALNPRPRIAALVAVCRTMADKVDWSSEWDEKAWREYRLSLAALLGACANDDEPEDTADEYDRDIAAANAKVRAKMGNQKNS